MTSQPRRFNHLFGLYSQLMVCSHLYGKPFLCHARPGSHCSRTRVLVNFIGSYIDGKYSLRVTCSNYCSIYCTHSAPKRINNRNKHKIGYSPVPVSLFFGQAPYLIHHSSYLPTSNHLSPCFNFSIIQLIDFGEKLIRFFGFFCRKCTNRALT